MYAHAYFSCIYAHDTPPRVQHFSAFHCNCTDTLAFVMESDVNGVLVAAITVPAIVLICVFAVASVTILFRLYQQKKGTFSVCIG